jgi:uncharacterized protein Usg
MCPCHQHTHLFPIPKNGALAMAFVLCKAVGDESNQAYISTTFDLAPIFPVVGVTINFLELSVTGALECIS